LYFDSSFTFLEYWKKHVDVQLVQSIQARMGKQQAAGDESDDLTSSEEEEEENSRKVPEADDNEAYGKHKQESSSGPEDSDLRSEFDVCNKFWVLENKN
jgi:hypothetical protein